MSSSVIIAPHSDDAILSVGGRLLVNPEVEEFSVLNAFSTCACTILPNLTDSAEITRLNNAEESAAIGSVGADLQFMYLPEVMLRGYKKWDVAPEYPKDDAVRNKLTAKILEVAAKANRIYFPLAIGNHTDHLICVDSAKVLLGQGAFSGKDFFFYEDLPYAIDSPFKIALDSVARYLGRALEERVIDVSEVIDRKVELIASYRTQYDLEYAKKMKVYAANISGKVDSFKERCWKLIG